MKKLTMLICFASLCITCMDRQPTNSDETAIAPRILWKAAGRQIIPSGIDSVRITVSSVSLPNSLIKTFPFEADTGTITGIPSGISISIKIEGLDSLGNVRFSGTIDVTNISGTNMEITIEANQVTPIAPSNLAAQAISYDKIQLVWSDNSSNEDYFVINRSDSTGQPFDSIGISTLNGYVSTGLAPAKMYQYNIYAVNAAGNSFVSNIATAKTMALDNIGPKIVVESHTNPDTVNTQAITLYGTVKDTSAISLFTVGDVIVLPNADQWMKQNFYLAGASNTIIIKAIDNSPLSNISFDTLVIIYEPTYVDTTNHAPVFTVPSDSLAATIKLGKPYRKVLAAFDPDAGDTLRYTVSAGLSLIGKDTVTWAPAISNTGANTFYALVYDSRNAKDSIAWKITVLDSSASAPNNPPEFLTNAGQLAATAVVGQAYLDTLSAQDIDLSQTLSYTVVSGPSGMDIGTQTGIIYWTPDIADTGLNYITARVTDDSAAYDELAWSIQVFPAGLISINHAPVFSTQQTSLTASGVVGTLYIDTVTATDMDAGNRIGYSVVNGPVSIDENTGIVTWMPGSAGNFGVTVRAIDDSTAYCDIEWNISVSYTNHAPSISTNPSDMQASGVVGSPYLDTVAATDSDPGNILTFSVVAGPISIGASNGIISWQPSTAGSNNIAVKVCDNFGKCDSLSWRIDVDLPPGLVAYYPFNGNSLDESGNGNHAANQGAILTTDRFGNNNSAYSFDGLDDYMEVADPLSGILDFQDNTFSISCWISIASYDHLLMIAGKGYGGNTNGDYSLHINNVLSASIGYGGPGYITHINDTLLTSLWYHIVAVYYPGDSAALFVNGQRKASQGNDYTTTTPFADSPYPFYIGNGEIQREGINAYAFSGKIDDVRLYNRALSAAEINVLYHEGGWTGNTIADIDGNAYHTVTIGTQVWTVENLRTMKYNDGSDIPRVTDSAQWANLTTPGYCYYNNTANTDSIEKFGALYNWYAVGTGKLAPDGWHVPTDSEWIELENYLIVNGYNWDGTTTGNKIAKSLAAKTDWAASGTLGAVGNDIQSNNRSGFTALPGSDRGLSGGYTSIGLQTRLWSATESDATRAYRRELHYGNDYTHRESDNKGIGYSVRLLRD